MTAQLLVRGARISDGTGLPSYVADVVVEDGTIAAVGRFPGVAANRVIDADGLDLLPGFIDVHTHYDAQLHFEPSASPSTWHGVTTVVTGNCGFTLAPSQPHDLPWLVDMLARVEGMSPASLATGVDFRGGSLGTFLGGLEGRIGPNVAAYVGHAAVRRWVMGPEASERAATRDEVQQMASLVDEAMREGALGFSTSQLDLHNDHEGKPVPPNLATAEEIVALSAVLAGYREGVMEHLCRTFTLGYDAHDRKLLRDMAIASGGKPLHVNMLLRFTGRPDVWRTCLDVLERYADEDGLRVHPMASANPKGLFISLLDTLMLDELATFREVLALPVPDRIDRFRDDSVRDRIRTEFASPERQFVFDWDELRVVTVRDAPHRGYVDRTIADIAAERGVDGVDAFLDLATEEELETLFVVDRPVTDEDREVISYLLRHPLTTPGSSDGGAHVNTFCGADYPTRVLTEYVDDSFPFEQAVRKLSAVPAATLGMWDRGLIRPGARADLVLLDRSELGVGDIRMVHDFPAGAGRLVVDQRGYRATIVNGVPVVVDGVATGATPGDVLRFNQ